MRVWVLVCVWVCVGEGFCGDDEMGCGGGGEGDGDGEGESWERILRMFLLNCVVKR